MRDAQEKRDHRAEALHGKVCLVTGASRALGATIARTLARYGARVAVNYRTSEEAANALCVEIVADGGVAVPVPADVSDATQTERLIATTWETLGPIDLLVNNAGPYDDTPFLTLPVAAFDHILATNLRSTYLLSQEAGRRMKARGHGQIIHIAASDLRHRSHSVYGLAKAGVAHLTEAMALELAPQVTVNALAPDLIADNEEMTPTMVEQAVAATPMGRLITRVEIAEIVCLFCTPAFAFVTGQVLVLDGGRSIPQIRMGA